MESRFHCCELRDERSFLKKINRSAPLIAGFRRQQRHAEAKHGSSDTSPSGMPENGCGSLSYSQERTYRWSNGISSGKSVARHERRHSSLGPYHRRYGRSMTVSCESKTVENDDELEYGEVGEENAVRAITPLTISSRVPVTRPETSVVP